MDSILDLHKCVIGQHSSCHISSPKNLSINFATDHNFKDSSKYALRSTLLKICITQKLTFSKLFNIKEKHVELEIHSSMKIFKTYKLSF